jgi:hypothetical protein
MGGDLSSLSAADYKDRSTGLAVFGFLLAILGCLSALLIPMMFFAAAAGAAGAPALRVVLPAAGLYGLAAILFISLGVGSILARRWARALTLVLAWIWLAFGIASFLTVAVWMPSMFQAAAPPGNQVPPQAMMFVLVFTLAIMGCMYVVLPGILVLFYQSKHVKATCEIRDPRVRWTDKCPLPVLALSVLLGFGAYSMLFMFSYGPLVPFFGVLLKGVPAIVTTLAVSALFAYLAWATYRLQIAAWWITLVVYLGFGASAVVTFLRVDLMDLYREMRLPADQLEIIEKSGMADRIQAYMPVMVGGFAVVFVGYMLWVRRYYAGRVPGEDS